MAVPVSALQEINPGAVIELFTLELNETLHGSTTIYRFHNGANLNANGTAYETLDVRDIITFNKTLGNGLFGGRWMMHCCTDLGSGAGRAEYTGSTFDSANTVSILSFNFAI